MSHHSGRAANIPRSPPSFARSRAPPGGRGASPWRRALLSTHRRSQHRRCSSLFQKQWAAKAQIAIPFASSDVSGLCGRLLGSQPSGPKRDIFDFHAVDDNVFADSFNSRFIHDTSVTHGVEIRPRFIPFKSDLGTCDGAATNHQINPLAAHKVILSSLRGGKRVKSGPAKRGVVDLRIMGARPLRCYQPHKL
jgi:hypothetical protein